MKYVELCTPGQSFDACRTGIAGDPDHAYPDGALLDIRATVTLNVIDPPPDNPLHVVSQDLFHYWMQFEPKYALGVLKVIEGEFGPGEHGKTPLRDITSPNFWVTAEGRWTCEDELVQWYSEPFVMAESDPADAFDKYRKPVPKAAAIWRRVGRFLVER
jgi:hypothetical protein